MHPHFRRLFNAQFTPALYEAYRRDLASRLKSRIEFRLAETPLFLPDDFRRRLVDAANAIVDELSEPPLTPRLSAAIPDRWSAPGMDALPNFAQLDFAVVRENGVLVPKLIELQGFASLSAFHLMQRDAWVEALSRMRGLDAEWSCWFSGHDRASFIELLRRTIVGDHDPPEVVLVDIDPPRQKTSPDFAATKLLFGVDAIDPRELTLRGGHLYRGTTRIRRIFNRIVFDELIAKNIELPFDFREALDVEWAPHPNWSWAWSKYALPFLRHESVPHAMFLSDVDRIPDDLSRYVLKPLFSFGGGGVKIEPGGADLDAIPSSQRHEWCLQEKVEYAPALEPPNGDGVKIEIRMLFFRPDDAPRLTLAQNLVRLSRGPLMGVGFNRDETWVGSTIGLHRPA